MNALVLIADDHADTRDGYEAYLKFVGARVVKASDGHEAIRLARELRPDVIVMDMRMPGLSGDEAIRALRADTRTGRIPIIGVSGLARDESGRGCDRYLGKPCLPDRLASAIRELLPQQN